MLGDHTVDLGDDNGGLDHGMLTEHSIDLGVDDGG